MGARDHLSAGGDQWRRLSAILRRAEGVLFDPQPRDIGRRELAAAGLAVVLAVGVLLARQTGNGSLDTLYAEDGRVFYQAVLDGDGTHLWASYNGYAHLVPRVLALTASPMPIAWVAPWFALTSATVTALLGAYVYFASRGIVTTRVARAALAAAFVALPVGQGETLNNAANLHWYLMAAAVWAMMANPDQTAERVLGATIVGLATLSDPLTVALVPLAVLRVATLRGLRRMLPVVALGAGLTAQYIASISQETDRFGAIPRPSVMWEWYVVRVAGLLALGHDVLDDLRSPGARRLSELVFGAVVLMVLAAAVCARRHAFVLGSLFAMSIAFFVLPVAVTGTLPGRYTTVPGILLWGVVVVAVERLWLTRSAGARIAVGVLLAVFVAGWAMSFRVENLRTDGPTWSAELNVAREECERSTGPVPVHIVPSNWTVMVPCGELG